MVFYIVYSFQKQEPIPFFMYRSAGATMGKLFCQARIYDAISPACISSITSIENRKKASNNAALHLEKSRAYRSGRSRGITKEVEE